MDGFVQKEDEFYKKDRQKCVVVGFIFYEVFVEENGSFFNYRFMELEQVGVVLLDPTASSW